MTNFEKVGLFMKTFGQEVKSKPGLGNVKINKLRIDLIDEELKELKYALQTNDLKEVADALTDILYVITALDMHLVSILINVSRKFKNQI